LTEELINFKKKFEESESTHVKLMEEAKVKVNDAVASAKKANKRVDEVTKHFNTAKNNNQDLTDELTNQKKQLEESEATHKDTLIVLLPSLLLFLLFFT
jgi:hypothetical protein